MDQPFRPSRIGTLVVVSALIITVARDADAAELPCSLVRASSHLADKLRCTFANVLRGSLSANLVAVADQLTISGTVQDEPQWNVYPFGDALPGKTFACHDSQGLTMADFDDTNCMHRNNDGDLTFHVILDPRYRGLLEATVRKHPEWQEWWSRPTTEHDVIEVEVLMFGRNLANKQVRLFPGWETGEGALFDGAPMDYDHFFDCQHWLTQPLKTWHCDQMWIRHSGRVLKKGVHVEISGAFVMDCNSGCNPPSGLEIHPAERITVK